MVLLDTGAPGTSGKFYSEGVDNYDKHIMMSFILVGGIDLSGFWTKILNPKCF